MTTKDVSLTPPFCAMCEKTAEKPRIRAYDPRANELVVSICSEKCFEEYKKTLQCFKAVSRPSKDMQVVDMEDIII